MVKSPRIRHSKASKEPVTIDLGAGDVKRVEADQQKEAGSAKPDAKDKATPDPATATKPEASEKPEAGPEPAPEEKTKPAATATRPDAAPEKPGAAPFDRDAADRPAGPQPASESPRRVEKQRRGAGAIFAAGLIGAAVALAGAWGLDRAGLLARAPQPHAPPPAVADDPRVPALEGELESLRAEIAALRDAAQAQGAGGEDVALREAVAAGQSRMEGLGVLIDEARAELAELREAVTEGGEAGGEVGGDTGEALVAPLQSRLEALEEAVSALPADGGADETEALRNGLETLGAELQQAVRASASAQETAAAAAARLDTLEERLAALSQSVEEQAERPGVALAIAASALKAAVDRGTPFTAELDTFAAIAPDAPEIEGLRAFAASGVPARSAIEALADRTAVRMIGAGREQDPQAGLAERLMSSARSLVTVRPIGAVEGDDVPAIVARLEAAVRAGDYEAALSEYAALPPGAQEAGEDFITQLRARAEADRLTGQALAAALRA